MPNCGHDHNGGWNDDLCLECGYGLSYYFIKEEREHTEREGKIIEAHLDHWRKAYRKEQQHRGRRPVQ